MSIQLPEPKKDGNKSLETCILNRESVRRFSNREVELEKISQLLWAAQGKKGNKRIVPSAGGTYPLEIYVTIKNKGLFHYNHEKHLLEIKLEEDLGKELAKASLNQDFINKAPLNIIICAIYSRTTDRYGKRGIRYVFMEIGHCAQNIHLEAVALGLGSVPIGAFIDGEIKNVLNLPDKIDPLYIIPIGYQK